MMKKFSNILMLAAAVAAFLMPVPRAGAEAICAMLTFSDNTRFHKIGGAGVLSDLVLEKLVAS